MHPHRTRAAAVLDRRSFLSLESLLQSALALRRLPGERGDWQEVRALLPMKPALALHCSTHR